MATTPIVRARQFLNYRPIAKWLALLAGALSGAVYIALLFLLVLFADEILNHGAIPTLSRLPSVQRNYYVAQTLPDESTPWKKRLETLGFEPHDAGVVPLLHFCEAKDENKLPVKGQELRRELHWRWYVFKYLQSNVGEDAAAHVKLRTQQKIKQVGAELALTRDIDDCGILGMLIRSQNRMYAPIGCWIARYAPWMWKDGFWTYLLVLFAIAFGLAICRSLLMFVNQYAAAITVTEAVTRLRRAIYHHTYRLGTLAFRALGPTEAVGVSTRHLEAVHDGLYAWLTVYWREPVKFVLLLVFALMVNPWLTMAFVMFALLVWIIGGQIAAYYRQQGRLASEKTAEQLALMQESLMLMRLVKVYLMELFNQRRVERQLAQSAEAELRRFRGEAVYRPLLVLFGMLAALLLLLIIGLTVPNGQPGVPGVIALATAWVSLYLPVQNWLENRRFVRRGKDSAEVLFEFLDRPRDLGQNVEAEFLPPLEEYLQFNGVSLREHGTGRKLLNDVSFKIAAGQRVALVGPDDMQKHALVYLLPRFLDPSNGEIRIDGRDLRWVTLDSLRAQTAIVLQHNLVFNDTIANNIGCGDKSYSLPQMIQVAKMAHAHQFIQKLPKGYETEIGDMGHPLTVGQKFQIALARAILRDPALLIVEEPWAPLDEKTKDLLDDTMSRVLPGRTVIFLPHRLSTIRHCDIVYLLHNGEIVASGEHKQLLSQNELYKHLQYLEFNEYAGIVGDRPLPSGML